MVFQHPFRDVKTVSKSIRLVLKKIPEFVPIPRNKPGCQGSCFSMLFNFQGPFPLLRAELYLSTFPEVCQQQVSVFVSVKGRALRPFRDSFAIIPRPFPFVNSFFAPFCNFFIYTSFFPIIKELLPHVIYLLLFCLNLAILFRRSKHAAHAPVAQWIEHRPPEPGALVRFQSGVPLDKDLEPFALRAFSFSQNLCPRSVRSKPAGSVKTRHDNS